MELVLRVSTRAADASDQAERDGHDVVAELEPTHTVGELIDALNRHLDVGALTLASTRTGEALDPGTTIADSDLMSGDEVVLGAVARGGAGSANGALPLRAVTLDVLAGPDSGRSLLLQPGDYTLGRGSDADIALDDPSVSRHHATITIDTDWSVAVDPAPKTVNGVTVNDELIDGSRALIADDVIGLGGTRIAFREFVRSEREHHDRLGQIDFHRTPYRPPTITPIGKQEFGPVPQRPEPRRFQILATIAPLAGGLLMYAFSRQVQFLALMALSPIIAIATWFDDRRAGRRTFADELAEFRRELTAEQQRLDALRHRERIDRLRSAPDLADLARRAELRTLDLWPRGRAAPDFLRLRLGLGSAIVHYEITVAQGGSADLRKQAEEAFAGLDRMDNVPVTADLAERPVLGVHGARDLVNGVASALAVQAASLHSPEDLTIAAAIAHDRPLDWLKWLPHLRSVASPLPGSHLVTNAADADSLVARLTEVAAFRTADRDRHRDVDRRWPRILVFVDGDLRLEPAGVSRLLDLAGDAGISVVWLAESAADVPRQAESVLAVSRGTGAAMRGWLWSTDPKVLDQDLEVEHLRPALADDVARALAPVRDASTASLATSIPRTVPLLDMLGTGSPTPEWVAEQWLGDHGYQLRFPIGVGADGVIEIDLVENGPHTLIGGTSGAGKSELLQSMVAALAARHPPTRLNFLFVDYKGGASSNVFAELPHTVGYVTNLSADLALRALTSLRAELNHRMRLMEGRAKDLAEMLDKHPDEAPASLVIVVDEFATLVKEVPEFVAGIIDIAQRGRSLGIHLVLATQRPSGSVNENILANTNLRISLRMLDRSESTAIIDSPEAAGIPVPLRGRGLLRLGPQQLVEFQSGYSSAPLLGLETRQPVRVAEFDRPDATPRAAAPARTADGATTQLGALIEAVATASRRLHHPPARRPWRDVLPELVVLHELAADPRSHHAAEHPGRLVLAGLLDDPAAQDQRPAVVDLETDGGWLVFGSGGSGKSTLLRTTAAAISAAGPGDVAIVVFDFASRALAALRELPDVVDVVAGDDLEAVTRQLLVLDAELTRRRALLADAGAESLTVYLRNHPSLPRIVVLIDGFDGVAEAFAGGIGATSNLEVWGERLQRIVTDGRQVGIHTIITASRRNAVPQRIHSAIARRLILRHADDQGYGDHGVSMAVAKTLDLPPGRGLLDGETLVQVASVSQPAGAREQAEYLAGLATRLDRPRQTALASAPLPETLPRAQVASVAGGVLVTPIGIEDVTAAPVVVDLEWSNLTVCGPPRSGRSTALATAALGLVGNHDVYLACSAASPLTTLLAPHLDPARVAVGRPDAAQDLLERLANLVAMGTTGPPPVLVVDDLEAYEAPGLAAAWEQLAEADGLRLIAALEDRGMSGYTMNPIVNLARRARRLLVLQPGDPTEFMQLTGLRSPLRPGMALPPGRGVLIADRVPTVLHVAHPTAD